MTRHILLLALPFVLATCESKKPKPAPKADSEIIEVLSHKEGEFTTTRSIPVPAIGSEFEVDGVTFTVAARWPHAETTRKVSDNAEKMNHGIEMSWKDEQETPLWIFQTDSDETMSPIDAVNALVRVTPPGARPPIQDQDSFAGQVQILWQGQLLDLPEIGAEVFDGWKLKSSKSYQHALLNDQGGVTEAEDSNFVNRVFEIHLSDDNGSEERHIAFLDHPEITRGIHPTILSVTRISGDAISNSRLSVCTPIQPATENHIIQISPTQGSDAITARVWLVGDTEFKIIQIDALPAEIPLKDDQTLRIERHFTHAHSQVEWERNDKPKEGEAKPALLIEQRLSHHQKQEFVLIQDEVTPCRIGSKHLMLRFANSKD